MLLATVGLPADNAAHAARARQHRQTAATIRISFLRDEILSKTKKILFVSFIFLQGSVVQPI